MAKKNVKGPFTIPQPKYQVGDFVATEQGYEPNKWVGVNCINEIRISSTKLNVWHIDYCLHTSWVRQEKILYRMERAK